MIWRLGIVLFLGILIGSVASRSIQAQEGMLKDPVQIAPTDMPRGVWVTVFSSRKILYSKTGIAGLLDYCRKNRISEIYLQIYRSGEAYFESQIAGQEKYQAMVKAFGGDPLDHLLAESKQAGIQVHAWVNVLSLAKNAQAPIIKKHGSDVLTRDQKGRASIRTEGEDPSDQYYLRDDQIFLEPGDERVVAWTRQVIEEITIRYPGFSGLHLDYIRYPYPVPFILDSRFIHYGISYGFGEQNLERFKKATGSNPRKDDMYKESLHLKWDNWKREQVTNMVAEVRKLLRNKAADWKLSCAVLPSHERAYSIAYQDWPLWLEERLVDHVILMNYTRDERLAQEVLKGALAYRGPGKVYSGLGAFLYKHAADVIRVSKLMEKMQPDGLVWFSYDDLADMDVRLTE